MTGAIGSEYVLAKVAHRWNLAWLGHSSWALSAAFWALSLAAFPVIGGGVVLDAPRSWVRAQLIDRVYLAHWSATFLALFALVPAALVALMLAAVASPHARLFAPFAAWVHGVLLAAGLLGTALARRFRVEQSTLEHACIPHAFDGYRVAHLSDLHVGTWTTGLADGWIRETNALDADLVVVTGDLVTSGDRWLERIAEIIGAFRARDGVMVCFGNHDWFADGERLTDLLRARGVLVLRNTSVVIERRGQTLVVGGVDDTWTGRANLDDLVANAARMPDILLAHDPDLFRAAAERGIPIMLSGHTHGGQVGLPFVPRLLNMAMLAHDYHLGLYKRGASLLYVSPGLGTSGPPLRLGVPAAIVVHQLRGA